MLTRAKIDALKETARNIIWEPQPGSQVLFLDSPIRETLYTGTRGLGKTDALLMDFCQHIGEGWGAEWQGILFRETYPQLQDVIKKSLRWFKRVWPDAVYNKSDKTWIWPTGEQLSFRHMNDPEDYWNYHGHAYPWIGWEELCNWITPDCYVSMMSCNRSTAKGIPRKVRATTNPYGKGHNWVRKRWHLPENFGSIIRDTDEAGNPLPLRIAIHGTLLENKILLDADPDYISTLRTAARNPQELQAWLYGSWDIIAGGAFDDLWDSTIHVIEPFDIPREWKIFRSFDWGASRPFSVGWWAESNGEEVQRADGSIFQEPAGTLIRFHEWYGTKEVGTNVGLNIGTKAQARGINRIETLLRDRGTIQRSVSPGPADNSIYDPSEDHDSPAEIMANEDVEWEKSDKSSGSRVRGLEAIRERLNNSVNKEGPGLKFVRGSGFCQKGEGVGCSATIELFPRLPRCDTNPDDVNTKAEDHFYDEIRYTILAAGVEYVTEIHGSMPRR